MPPRKRKVVKKTVRKIVKKTPATTNSTAAAETNPPSSPPADIETATDDPVPANTEAIPSLPDTNVTLEPSEPTADETLAPEIVPAETVAPESVPAETLAPEIVPAETVAPEPVPAETLAPVPVPDETLAPEPVPAETIIGESAPAESLDEEAAAVETQAKEPALAETLETEPASTSAIKTPGIESDSTEAPSASETAPARPVPKTKTVLRVRKVVKKKIVKKLVPKPCSAAAATVAKDAAATATVVKDAAATATVVKDAAATVVKDDVNDAQPETTPIEVIPSEQLDIKNPSSDAASGLKEEAAPEKAVIGSENGGDTGKENNAEIVAAGNEEDELLERSKRRKTEIFIGGLDRDAKEEDLRKVFGEAGEIVEVRMIMNGQSGKNKGYAFLRYAEASQAKKAVADFEKVEVCGKICGASALKGNDTIFLGNIDKKWKKEDIIKLLQQVGIEKIETVTVMVDPNNADTSRGFAFLELESNKDAQIAYKKLQKKDALGKGRNIKVAWAEPFNDPDEEEMKKVKSVYAEGIPSSWDEEKVRKIFKKFGEIERVVLARNIQSAKRKDFAFVNYTTRQAAQLCIESLDKEFTDNNSQISLKVSLAKPVQKGKQNKGGSKSTYITEKARGGQRDTKANISSTKGISFKRNHTDSGEKSSTAHEFMLREQWRQSQTGYAGVPTIHDYAHGSGAKRHFSSLGHEAQYSDFRGYPRARLDSSFTAGGSSYGAMPHSTVGSSFPHYQHQGAGYGAGSRYGATDYTDPHQTRQGAPPPYGSSYYSRY